jgi:hypothetical protein
MQKAWNGGNPAKSAFTSPETRLGRKFQFVGDS